MKIKVFVFAILMGIVAGFGQAPNTPIARIETTDLYSLNSAKYIGINFLYHNLIRYNPSNYTQQPPFPYVDGRVRDGKYKASQTAMDNYIKDFTAKYNDKIFKVVKFVQSDVGFPAVVFACENGDTLYYTALSAVSGEFINKDLLDAERKKIGSKFFFKNESYNQIYVNTYKTQLATIRSYGFRNLKTKEYEFFFPSMSEWKILDVSFDTEYIGERSMMNDGLNAMYNRIKYTVENKIYGKYEAYLQEPGLQQLIVYKVNGKLFSPYINFDESSYTTEDLQNLRTWAKKGDAASVYYTTKIEESKNQPSTPKTPQNKSVSSKIIECAKNGYIYAVNEAVSAGNVPVEDKFKFIDAAKKKYGESDVYAKFKNSIASSTSNIIFDIGNSEDIGKKIALYERMVGEYSVVEKNGITSFEWLFQPMDVKTEKEKAVSQINELKQVWSKESEIEVLEKGLTEKEEKLEEIETAINEEYYEIVDEYKKSGDRDSYMKKLDLYTQKKQNTKKVIQKLNSEISEIREQLREKSE